MTKDAAGPLAGLGAQPRTRAEQLAALIEARIRSESLAPGSPVGTLDEIRRESGFARATVSEAIQLLRDRGVLAVKPGRRGGLFVADQGPVVKMRQTLLTVRDDPASVADAIELRNHLEELIDLGAARCRSDEDIAGLRACVAEMGAAADWEAFLRANWKLHERIAVLCPNAMARAVYLGTLGQLTSTTPRLDDTDAVAYRARRLRIHADLVEAISSGDEAAVKAAVAEHNKTD